MEKYHLPLAGQEQEFLLAPRKLLHPHPVVHFPHVNISGLSDGDVVSPE
jgi:hypothetical protein